VLIAIFAVQMIFFWCAVQIFWCAGKKILSEQYKLLPQVLPPYERVLPPYVKFFKRSTEVCCIFLGGGGCKSLSMDSLLLSKIRNKSSCLKHGRV